MSESKKYLLTANFLRRQLLGTAIEGQSLIEDDLISFQEIIDFNCVTGMSRFLKAFCHLQVPELVRGGSGWGAG